MLIAAILTLGSIATQAWMERGSDRYVPGVGPYKLICILSDSMKPVIQAGDAIWVDSRGKGDLGRGDIITYWRQNNAQSLLTHRIIEVEERGGQNLYYTRGDANNVMDGNPVPMRDVVGKYLFTIPWGGFFIAFIHTRAGFFLLIMLPLLLALLWEIKRIYPEVAMGLRNKDNGEPDKVSTEA